MDASKVIVVEDDSVITKALIAKLKEAAVEVVNVGTEGHIDHGSMERCSVALQTLGLSAEEAASSICDFVEVVRPEPIRIPIFRNREILKELKVEAPKPWERESWRRKKKGRT